MAKPLVTGTLVHMRQKDFFVAFVFIISLFSADISFAEVATFVGQWECTLNGQAPLDLKIEETIMPDSTIALKMTPALSLAHHHKGLLVIGSYKLEEQKDYFENEDESNSGMFNYIQNVESVDLDNAILRLSSIESYHRSQVNRGVEGPVILQKKGEDIMELQVTKPQVMQIREYSSYGRNSKPKLVMQRLCLKK